MVIKHNPVFIAEGLLGDPMKLFCRHRAVIVHFTVYVFCLSGQFKPGKIRGNIQIIDVAEYLCRLKLVLYFLENDFN